MALSRDMSLNLIAWAGNVLSSVAIVFVNKNNSPSGKGSNRMPLQDLAFFTFVADASIITLNLSLLLNPVSTYQIAKLLIIPFVCLVERFVFGRIFSTQVIGTILMVVFGVSIVTLEEISFDGTPLGLMIAAGSVVSSGMQQILVRTMQKKHNLSSNELLGATAPSQAASLLLFGPFIDKLVSSTWVFSYSFSAGALVFLMLSCGLAVLVNISQFMCLGRFTAVTFQVLGHAKTILVLMGSWLFLGETASTKKLFGMVLAVAGMVLYGKASMAQAPPPPPVVLMTKQASGPDAEEGEPLVMGPGGNGKEGVLGSGPISRH
ncbi:hypothetical protein N2152v2_001465 [Parachlorella kessleri]